MNGPIDIRIQDSHISYEFILRRKITVITGDSATGKSTLVLMVQAYNRNETFVNVSSRYTLVAVNDTIALEAIISTRTDMVLFLDEEITDKINKDIAAKILKSDNFFVFVTRKMSDMIPVSVQEMYKVKNSGKYNFLEGLFTGKEEISLESPLVR
jgi:hypothetical protein